MAALLLATVGSSRWQTSIAPAAGEEGAGRGRGRGEGKGITSVLVHGARNTHLFKKQSCLVIHTQSCDVSWLVGAELWRKNCAP